MRKLKLQVNITLDGFIASTDGKADWVFLPGQQDPAAFQKVIELAESSDTLLMGRKMTSGFFTHWENIVDNMPENPAYPLARLMVDLPKIIFSRSETATTGRNAKIENGDLATVVQRLKEQPGKDILVYGGAGFVSSLISLNLIDEYYLIINPVVLGAGMPIFKERKILKLESSIAYNHGKVLNKYLPA